MADGPIPNVGLVANLAFRPDGSMPGAVPGPGGLLMKSELELIKPHITQRPNARTLRRTLTGARTPLWYALCGAHSAADSHAAQTQRRAALWQAPSLLQTLKVGQDVGPTSSTVPACSRFRTSSKQSMSKAKEVQYPHVQAVCGAVLQGGTAPE